MLLINWKYFICQTTTINYLPGVKAMLHQSDHKTATWLFGGQSVRLLTKIARTIWENVNPPFANNELVKKVSWSIYYKKLFSSRIEWIVLAELNLPWRLHYKRQSKLVSPPTVWWHYASTSTNVKSAESV